MGVCSLMFYSYMRGTSVIAPPSTNFSNLTVEDLQNVQPSEALVGFGRRRRSLRGGTTNRVNSGLHRGQLALALCKLFPERVQLGGIRL